MTAARPGDERKTLNDDPTGSGRQNQFDPGIAIAPGGRVDIAWYDGRHSPSPADDIGSGLQDVYYSSSGDQGRTFTPNLRISDRSIDRKSGCGGTTSAATPSRRRVHRRLGLLRLAGLPERKSGQ